MEVYLQFRHRGIINTVVVSYYSDDRFFLPIKELFDLFQIEANVEGLIISGKYSTRQTPYSIDLEKQVITFGEKKYTLTTEDFILMDLDNYLPPKTYSEIFGLEFSVDFNNLTLHLETEGELPVIEKALRERRRKLADSNRNVETYYPLKEYDKFKMLDGGFMDYGISINSTTSSKSLNYNSAIGMQLAGGDLSGTIYGNLSESTWSNTTNNLRWRYFIRENDAISKVTVGQSAMDGVISNSYTGIRVTNEPIEPRRLFDEFEVQGSTIPKSEVELYLNNALIDFGQADEVGNYRFLTPLYYGSSQLDLRIYGPTGQIIEQASRIQVPFTFVPQGKLTYRINAGILDNPIIGDTERSTAFQGNAAYGLTSWLTTKLGVEYYDKGLEQNIPSITSLVSARIQKNYLVTLEAVTNAYYRAALNTIYPNSASLSFDYTKYTTSSGIYNNSGNDQQVVASIYYPFSIAGHPLNVRTSTFTRFRDNNSFSTMRFDVSTNIQRVRLRFAYSDRLFNSFNIFDATASSYMEASATYNISKNRNIPKILQSTFLRAQMRYMPTYQQFQSTEVLLSKSIFKRGRIQVSYGRNFVSQYNAFKVNFVIDLNKVRSNTTFSTLGSNYNATQNVRGSIGYDTNYHNFITTSRNQVGRSGTVIKMYVDENNNDQFDEGEEQIKDGAMRMGRGGTMPIRKNGVVYYTQMQSYYRYNLELNKGSIKNPMIVSNLDKFSIIAPPNSFQKIEVPFYMTGVIEGSVNKVFLTGRKNGIGGLKLILKSSDNDYTKELRTFTDGAFYEYEVPPGKYELIIDNGSLQTLEMKSNPEKIEFEVKAIPEGDFVEGLNFELYPLDYEETEEADDEVITEPSSQSSSNSIPGVGVSNTANEGGGISIEYSLPVTELEKNKCRYGFQLGAYSSYDKANEAAAALPIDSYVIYNSARQLYAIRSGLYQSLASTAKSMKEISGNTPSDASVLNQCYGTVASNFIPGSNLYHLQFGAFSNRIRANLFSKQINEQFGLKSFVAQDEKDKLYKVRLGPFETKGEANRERSDMLSNTSIRQLYISESQGGARMINVDFEYMLQLGEFADKEKALLYAIRIESEFDIKSRIVIDENESVVLFANKTFVNWNEILDLKKRIEKDATFEDPILHLYEKKIEEVSLIEKRPSDEIRKPFIEIVREN